MSPRVRATSSVHLPRLTGTGSFLTSDGVDTRHCRPFPWPRRKRLRSMAACHRRALRSPPPPACHSGGAANASPRHLPRRPKRRPEFVALKGRRRHPRCPHRRLQPLRLSLAQHKHPKARCQPVESPKLFSSFSFATYLQLIGAALKLYMMV